MPDEPADQSPAAKPGSVLGFDYGGRRIGVAIGQRIIGTASPVAVVPNGANGPAWPDIERLVKQWRPDAIVVGLPLTMDGSEQPASRAAKDFANALRKRYDVPVIEHDERLSSVEADRRFKLARQGGQRRQKDAALLDAIAAQVIVESYFSDGST